MTEIQIERHKCSEQYALNKLIIHRILFVRQNNNIKFRFHTFFKKLFIENKKQNSRQKY